MTTVKSIQIGNYTLTMCVQYGLYYVLINDNPVQSRSTLTSAMSRFDMEYNSYCINHQ